jgi:hypothetical protein
MVAVKKSLSAVLTLCLVCLAAPVAAQVGSATPKPATTDKTTAPSAPVPESRTPNAKISQNLAQRRIGLVCTVYAGNFDWWTLTLRIKQYSTMGLVENCDEPHYDSLTLASMQAQLRAVQQPLFVVRGGAHRYLMDVNLATLPNPYIRIGELLFSAVGELRIGILDLVRMENYIPDNLIASNYRPFTMNGNIQYIWNIGKPIHRLVAPNGDRYIMYGYTTRVIKQLTQTNLAEMGPLLNKPEGWKYESFLLDKTLTIKTTPANGFKVDFLFDDANNLYIKHED